MGFSLGVKSTFLSRKRGERYFECGVRRKGEPYRQAGKLKDRKRIEREKELASAPVWQSGDLHGNLHGDWAFSK